MLTDPAALLEVAYDLERDPASWAKDLVQAVEPCFPAGTVMIMWGSMGDHRIQLDLVWCRDGAFAAYARDNEAKYTPGANRYLLAQGPVFSWRRAIEEHGGALSAADEVHLRTLLSALGVEDFWVCYSGAPDEHVVSLGVGLASGAAGLSRQSFASWRHTLAHLRSAYRLRKELARGRASAEAVLSPDGRRTLHLEGRALEPEAREALRRAVRALDRGRMRRGDPYERLLARRVLVSGRWSLADRFDADGRRFTVAWVNEPVPRSRPLPELSGRDEQVALFSALGHPLKLIAYELGIGQSAVARSSRRAEKALGVAGRAALIRMVHTRLARAELGVEEPL